MPVPIAPGVWRVPLGPGSSFLLDDGEGPVAVVDAGPPGSSRRIVAALAEIGHRPSDVAAILVSHAHPDHAGGALALRRRTGAPVLVHEDDADYLVRGWRPPADPGQPAGKLADLVSRRQPACPVDGTFLDAELVAAAGGVLVRHTPGHTPGHSSFWHRPSGVLVVGDALRAPGRAPRAWTCTDADLARRTAARLLAGGLGSVAYSHAPGRGALRPGASDPLAARDRSCGQRQQAGVSGPAREPARPPSRARR